MRIVANSSDLGELLKSISAISGMTVEGLAHTRLISGTYGPGKPREVLTELLEHSSYNFLMAGGSPDGIPHELVLTARTVNPGQGPVAGQQTSAASETAHNAPAVAAPETAAASAAENSASAEPSADPANSEPLGPGAIAHVPPNEAEDGGSQDAGARMQQHLQRLQQLQQTQSTPQ